MGETLDSRLVQDAPTQHPWLSAHFQSFRGASFRMEGSCKLKARRATNSNEPRSDDSSAILYYINFVDASFCFAVSLSIGEEELEGIFFAWMVI